MDGAGSTDGAGRVGSTEGAGRVGGAGTMERTLRVSRAGSVRGRILRGMILPVLLALAGFAEAVTAQQTIELPGEDVRLTAEVEDLYAVGALDGEAWETFSGISAVAFDLEGNLLLLDRDNFRVVKVGPSGELLVEMGREGGGPGEFGFPTGMAVLADGTISVFDMGQRGFTLFNPDGSFRNTIPLADGLSAIPGLEHHAHPGGGVVSAGMTMVRASAGGVNRYGATEGRPIHRFSLEDGSSSTLFEAWKPVTPDPVRTQSSSSGGTAVVYAGTSSKVFDPELYFGVLPDGNLAVVDSTDYRVKVVSDDGTVLRTLSRPLTPQPVTRRVREAEKARRLEEMESGLGGGVTVVGTSGGTVRRVSDPAALRERVEQLEFAEVVPVVAGLATDPQGRIWIERAASVGEERGLIDILDSRGEYLGTLEPGTLRIPDAFGPGGLVAFIERDEFDVPRVEVKRLRLGGN